MDNVPEIKMFKMNSEWFVCGWCNDSVNVGAAYDHASEHLDIYESLSKESIGTLTVRGAVNE